MDDPMFVEEKTLVLRKPVKLGEVEYDRIELREPTAGEVAHAERGAAGSTDMAITLVSKVAGVPRAVVERMCQRDFVDASDFLGGFTVPGRPTGEKS